MSIVSVVSCRNITKHSGLEEFTQFAIDGVAAMVECCGATTTLPVSPTPHEGTQCAQEPQDNNNCEQLTVNGSFNGLSGARIQQHCEFDNDEAGRSPHYPHSQLSTSALLRPACNSRCTISIRNTDRTETMLPLWYTEDAVDYGTDVFALAFVSTIGAFICEIVDSRVLHAWP